MPCTGPAPVTDVRVVSGGLGVQPGHAGWSQGATAHGGSGATPIQGVAAVPDGNGGAAAVLRADGVDLAGLIARADPVRRRIGAWRSDPRYNLVYYQDDVTKALVTGLYQPGDFDDYAGTGRTAADGSVAPAHPHDYRPPPAPPPGVWTR